MMMLSWLIVLYQAMPVPDTAPSWLIVLYQAIAEHVSHG
jgi:hypothetical protein